MPGLTFNVYLSIHDANETATSMINFTPVGSRGIRGWSGAKGQKGATGVGSKGATGSGSKGQKGEIGSGQKGQKGATGSSGVFSGGTVSSPIKISSTTDEKIILEKSTNPYIRFREGTTNKAYIQWNSNGNFYFVNSESGEHLRIGSSTNGLVYHMNGSDKIVYHSGNFTPSSYLRSNADDTMTGLLTLDRASDEQLRIKGTTNGNPYVSFYQDSTRRAYIQFVDSTNNLRLYNDVYDDYVDIGNGINGLTYVADGTRRTVWHSGNLATGDYIRSNANDNVSADTEWQDNKAILLGNSGDYKMHHNSNHHTYFQNRNHGKSTFFQSENSSGTNKAHLYLEGGASPYVRLFQRVMKNCVQ